MKKFYIVRYKTSKRAAGYRVISFLANNEKDARIYAHVHLSMTFNNPVILEVREATPAEIVKINNGESV